MGRGQETPRGRTALLRSPLRPGEGSGDIATGSWR